MIRIGILGSGFISQVAHLYSFSRNQKCQIVALADARSNLCEKIAQKFSIPSTFSSYEEMFRNVSLDGVVISLPRSCLGPATEMALNRGVSVLSEKPMAQTVKDAQNLVTCANNNKTPYYIGFMRRSDPGVNLFKGLLQKWIKSSSYGLIQHVVLLDFCGEYAVPIPSHIGRGEKPQYRYNEWTKTPEGFPDRVIEDYQYSMNVLIHDINLVRYLFDMDFTPESFTFKPGHSQMALLKSSCFSVALNIGKSAIGVWDQVLHVYFQKGRLSLYLVSPLERQASSWVEEQSMGEKVISYPNPEKFKWAFEKQADTYLEGFFDGNSLSSTGQDSLKDIKIIEDLWKLVI